MSTEPVKTAYLDSATPVVRTSARRVDRYLAQRYAGRSTGYAILIGLTVLSIFPLVWMVLTSLRERHSVFGGPLFPERFTLDAYQFMFNEFHIVDYFGNSILVTAVTVFAVVTLATLTGYAFAHLEFWGKEIIFLFLLGTLMVPPTVLLLPLFLQLRDFGLIDKQLGLILAYIGGGLAFSVFLMRSFFKTLPTELIDAGRVDGASEFGIFWRIMLPLARPGIATVLIFQFSGTWNEFIYAATLIHTPEMRNLQPAIFSMVGRYSTNWPALTAALTLSVLPIIVVYIFMQRQFVAGLTAGAVKQ
ncbi:MAG: carbohydrate ABC transporter permease [Anaerolineae bacterium]|nr:carbohydrate ABC transporter permease [Anaerolineae bacterium]